KVALARERNDLLRIHCEGSAHKDPVNAGVVFRNGFLSVEGAEAFAPSFFRQLPRIKEEIVGNECFVGLVGFGRVESAGQDDRLRSVESGDTFTQQLGAFFSGDLNLMIEMRVELIKLVFSLPVEKSDP